MKRESAEFGFLGKRAKKGIFTAEIAEDAEMKREMGVKSKSVESRELKRKKK